MFDRGTRGIQGEINLLRRSTMLYKGSRGVGAVLTLIPLYTHSVPLGYMDYIGVTRVT